MAIITIARQVAALGDEIARKLSSELGYQFIDRKFIEKRIVELGFPEEKMVRYDERKPGFFASLSKNRDEYLYILQLAILEAAEKNNCILIGRGAFSVLEGVPNVIAVRCVSDNLIRKQRLMDEFDWDEKQASQRIQESDVNRKGFHKSFFNLDNEDDSLFHMTLNTSRLSEDDAASIISALCKLKITEEKEQEGCKKVKELLAAQKLVNKIIFEGHVNINFLRAVISDGTLSLQGVADSAALAEKAMEIAKLEFPQLKVESCISVVQDFKAYP
ncbi:MAG: cytidylate kinase family protein [Treponema sp.]|uniref:cytidylate kinase family protein n=1 Tax=Treponema sp. TaxID=166 RepID=UPI00298E783C|nr:cytidylate kinase family protein [Treponema sp.]MCQ2602056.1 cytidylate kinase family protein [Treponema sp.]